MLNELTDIMYEVEKAFKLSKGEDKKKQVLIRVVQKIDDDIDVDFLSTLIDFIVELVKNKKFVKAFNTKTCKNICF